MAMKKTMRFLTLVASISLIGLACEAAQKPNTRLPVPKSVIQNSVQVQAHN